MSHKDLTQRLREFEGSDDLGNGDFSVCQEAAERIRELESKLSDLVAYCKDGYGDHEADEVINAEKLLEQPR